MFSDKEEAGGVEDEQENGRKVWLLKRRLMGTLAYGYKGGDLIKVQNREAA